ncbi:ABC transporter permease [Marmoricola endophyticus]|uniref:ABC transporter permease n=1 Tax=Marmoricola endophyticus TaxID=2040280 RepID=A0A917BL03_9ACTN|nr:ABC transporter permease [Marmoricola endophyticus]GGF44736.1 ABC transporter permease [Marmoricola endophyticus]
MNGLPFFDYLSAYRDQIILRTEQHFQFSAYVIVGAVVIGLLIAVLTYQSGIRGNFAISTAAIAFTLPAVALFGFLVSVFGQSLFGAVYPPVVLYALLPVLRNGIVGLQSADPAVIDAARGMGVGPWRMLWQIRFPIAWPLILAGIRVSAQLAVGIFAIGAFVVDVGLGTYGFEALDNLGSVNTGNEAIVCIVFVALVALVFDAFFVIVRYFTTPRGSRA